MGLWHEIKVRLGLADDYDEYEDEEYYADEPEDEADSFPPRRSYRTPYSGESSPGVKRVNREPDIERARGAAPSLRSVPSYDDRPERRETSVRPAEPAQVKMHIVEPHSFSEAQQIADKFKVGIPVIMNLTLTDPDLAKRLIDFASGLTYGLSGGLQKVSEKVFMLTPANIDVSAEDRRRLRDKGLFSAE